MHIDTTFLRSKVARRIFLLFVSCALLPIVVLTLLYYGYFTKQLTVKTERQLHQTSKDLGMYIYERLLFLETELKMVTSRISSDQHAVFPALREELALDVEQHFKAFVLMNDSETPLSLFGEMQDIPPLTPSEIAHIRAGNTVILTSKSPGANAARIFISKALDPSRPRKGIVLAEINPSYLWGIGDENPWMPAAEFCVLDHSNTILFSTLPPPLTFPQKAVYSIDSNISGQFEWQHNKKQYVAGYWSLFLKPRYYTPKWTVVLSESKADVLAPAATFKTIFPFIIFLTLLVVVLLSIVQIRRNLVPLEKLQKGTWNIAQRDFGSRVTIKTGDEFEELAASFNTMADRLGKQFKTLTAVTEIDRSILSSLDTDKIIEVVLNRIHDVLPSDYIGVTLFYVSTQDTTLSSIYMKGKGSEIGKEVETLSLTPVDLKNIYKNPEVFITDVSHTTPRYLTPLTKRGIKSFLIFPLFVNQMLSGIITLGYLKSATYSEEDISQIRQLANQVAVALSNTRLVEELEQLHLGTLTALARAIDAKSRWTAGHSERVTKLALKIAEALGMSPKELEVLRRGGLLHDIGKIGIPAEILDKSGTLKENEKDLIREHVQLGARILEPIAAFTEIMPIVLQHHEHFDGTGYPNGLSGEAIHLSARIFAVADAFDALTSHRPYKNAIDRKEAIEIIKQGAGKQFDPGIVQAFVEVIKGEEDKKESFDEHLL